MKGSNYNNYIEIQFRGVRTDKYAFVRTSLQGAEFYCHIQFIIFTYFLHDQGDFLGKSNVYPSIGCIPGK